MRKIYVEHNMQKNYIIHIRFSNYIKVYSNILDIIREIFILVFMGVLVSRTCYMHRFKLYEFASSCFAKQILKKLFVITILFM